MEITLTDMDGIRFNAECYFLDELTRFGNHTLVKFKDESSIHVKESIIEICRKICNSGGNNHGDII